MNYKTLGKTGLSVSAVGFGGIPIQRITKEEARPLLEAVRAAGINYIDTAKAYTVSEEWIGAAIRGMRDDFILATKSMARTKEAMAADIADSLAKLQTEYIDLYQIHNPNMAQLDQVLALGGALEALMEAKSAGKIGHIGLTAHSREVFERALELDFVETIMFPYNIVETQGEDLIARCAEKNIGFIAMKPMAGGAIEDGTLAMRFICANHAVSVVIPGMYCAEEVAQNCAAAADFSSLSAEEQAKIAAVRADLGESFCRRCNYCAPCAVGISIPSVFLFEGYLSRYNLQQWAHERYATLSVKASACIGCGVCEERCPYHLPIREMMKRAAAGFGE
ncbi:MAG: aldo/keto reductase [Ruminococcaceae bacterium]|nr:aldo/keto reductase [Oscillospiraceae bacterium]